MSSIQIESDFLRYLLAQGCAPGSRLPSLNEISSEIGVSVGKLREQLEVARVLGLIQASPRRGIHYTGYDFLPAVRQSLMVGLNLDRHLFERFSSLRGHLEIAFWDEAVGQLTDEDHMQLRRLVSEAWAKLQHERIQIPHAEHRAFHMTIFRRLDNLFVTGLLDAYWDAYEAVELNTYADYHYLTAVWRYHEEIAQAICTGEYEEARRLHIAHMGLLNSRGTPLKTEPLPLPADSLVAAGEVS